MDRYVLEGVADGLSTITLNRPDRRNRERQALGAIEGEWKVSIHAPVRERRRALDV